MPPKPNAKNPETINIAKYTHKFRGGAHFFSGEDGVRPESGLELVGSALFSTTRFGGLEPIFDEGTVFSVNLDNSNYQVLHSFGTNFGDELGGFGPTSGVTVIGSTLYGTTTNGGISDDGVVFSMNLDGSNYQVLHTFNQVQGAGPFGRVTTNGSKIFGTTNGGGDFNFGVVYEMNLDGSDYRVLHSFNKVDGRTPLGDLVLSGSWLYGVTNFGGVGSDTGNGSGTIYRVAIPEQTATMYLSIVATLGLFVLAYRYRRHRRAPVVRLSAN